ncbi:MAG: DUF1772 domain-containing protein [Gemmatimonadales bacterium]
MALSLPRILLWLFVINLGIAFGAGLYEGRIEFPRWLSRSAASGYQWNAAAAREANTGLRFWVYVTTVPLTVLTLANLVAAWLTHGPVRSWWLAAGFSALVDRLLTFAYFIPTMVKLQASSLGAAEAVALARQWGQLNYVRHALILVAWLAALRAFARL